MPARLDDYTFPGQSSRPRTTHWHQSRVTIRGSHHNDRNHRNENDAGRLRNIRGSQRAAATRATVAESTGSITGHVSPYRQRMVFAIKVLLCE